MWRLILSEKKPFSTMRLCVFSICVSCVAVFIAITIHVIAHTFTNTPIDWNGVGAVIAATAVPMTGALGAKAYQKSKENPPKVLSNGS